MAASPYSDVKRESAPSPHLAPPDPAPQFKFQLHTPPDTQSPTSPAAPTMSWPVDTPVYTLPFADYDDDEIDDDHPPAAGKDKERLIRRRSSKACDQCRKAKCKCERSSDTPGAACRACVLVGTECTFLGPSRKRGPPKGYIDAIEARLHQTEALVGILLAAARGLGGSHEDEEDGDDAGGRESSEREADTRARTVLRVLGEDPLARAIITRIDHSAYGPAGRGFSSSLPSVLNLNPSSSNDSTSNSSNSTPAPGLLAPRSQTNSPRGTTSGAGAAGAGEAERAANTHPSHEWMDRVTAHMLRRAREARRHSQARAFETQAGRFEYSHSPHSRSPVRAGGSGTATPLSGNAISLAAAPYRFGAGFPPPLPSHGQHQPPQRPAIITALPQGLHGQAAPHSAGPGYSRVGEFAPMGGGHAQHQFGVGLGAVGDHHHRFPLSAGAVPDGGAHRFPLPMPLAGSDGRRLRRRVDGGEGLGMINREGSQQGFGGEREPQQQHQQQAFRESPQQSQQRVFRSGPPSSGGSFQSGPYSRGGSPASEAESEVDVDVGHVVHEGGGAALAEDGAGLAGAVGQLSLNEDKQVRYHGKISGLHLLARRAAGENGHEPGPEDGGARGRAAGRRGDGTSDRRIKEEEELGKNVGGIWRFPKARVWPAAPSPERDNEEAEVGSDGLPPRATQEALLNRYFTYVHPSFPVVHKRTVLDGFAGVEGTPRPPPLLLLAMYALAARHAPQPPGPAVRTKYMWPAGDTFLFRAKVLLDSSYASSRASTCTALLLMGFREIGIGAMAQAWIYIGMAVRMAQDLGMQRDADGWARAGVRVGEDAAAAGRREGAQADGEHELDDSKLFSPREISERRRIWYACVIMDKYVSTYIGRPLAIFECDFDTSLPSENDAEEIEEWLPVGADAEVLPECIASRPAHVISCFNASARLSGILSQIVQSIYALRPARSRHAELLVLDEQLEKWLLALPAHLRHDPAVRASGEVPVPQVLTLHMQYWCAVLLLHRPFIRQHSVRNKHSPAPEEGDVRGNAEKSYELCAAAANHITAIAVLYSETYTLKHCPVFHCYYIFTASIMHVISLSAHPTDPQARKGLTKCMDALREMEIIWPAAARAFELLRGAPATLADVEVVSNNSPGETIRRKRSATQSLDDRPFVASENFVAMRPFVPVYQPNGHYGIDQRSSYYAQPSSPYERWSTEGATGAIGAGALTYQGALSTAVMGPAYSTGLVDERHHRVAPQEGEPRYEQQQYWGDYSFPQLGAGYSGIQDPGGMTMHHSAEQQLYPNAIQDQYRMYPNHP